MNINELRGCGTALVTPFRDGQVDYDAFAALVDYQIKGGVDFLVPLGTTGETPCLTDEEKIKVLTIAKEHCRSPVHIVPIGIHRDFSPGTCCQTPIDFIRHYAPLNM